MWGVIISKICSNCGKENDDKATFCKNCGSNLPEIYKNSLINPNIKIFGLIGAIIILIGLYIRMILWYVF